jgi:hypothetical protein
LDTKDKVSRLECVRHCQTSHISFAEFARGDTWSTDSNPYQNSGTTQPKLADGIEGHEGCPEGFAAMVAQRRFDILPRLKP